MEKTKVLTFEPLLKQTIWGGDRIKNLKYIDTTLENIGESWEVSGVEGSESVVADGCYKGRKLNELVAEFKESFVGKDNYKHFGNEFPLLVKFIDARQDLSIQVHPSDDTANRQGLKRGKTEMWFTMDSTADAKLCCGLKNTISPEEYKAMVADDTICNVIREYRVKADECYFIPAGCIHSIGAGCFLAEIQETSDVTYRIYDYKRKDKNGNYRELHTERAAESIDFDETSECLISYEHTKDAGVPLISCKHFCTAVYDLSQPMTLDYSELDSFVILVCVAGEGCVTDEDGNITTFKAGSTILLPAWVGSVTIEGNVKFLETYV